MPWYWVKTIQTKLHELRIFLECIKDTNTPSVFELQVSEVGPRLGHRVKDPTKRWKIAGFFPSFIYFQILEFFEVLGYKPVVL